MYTPKTEELDEHLRRLVAMGMAVQVDKVVYPVAYAEAGNDAVFWIAMPGRAMNHTHVTEFTKAEIHHGRDVLLRAANGQMVAYFAPYTEFREKDPEGFLIDWHEWLDFISVPENEEKFLAYVEGEKRSRFGK